MSLGTDECSGQAVKEVFFLFILPIPRPSLPIPFHTEPANYGLPDILGRIFVPFFLLFFIY